MLPDDWGDETVPLSSLVRGKGQAPTRLVVFRRPIEHRATDREELEAMVHTVVVEQLAELLGPHARGRSTRGTATRPSRPQRGPGARRAPGWCHQLRSGSTERPRSLTSSDTTAPVRSSRTRASTAASGSRTRDAVAAASSTRRSRTRPCRRRPRPAGSARPAPVPRRRTSRFDPVGSATAVSLDTVGPAPRTPRSPGACVRRLAVTGRSPRAAAPARPRRPGRAAPRRGRPR